MMTGPLAAYLRGLLAWRTVAVLCALGGLLQVLELLDTATDIMSRGQGLGGIIRYTLMRSPTVLLSALPLSALLGAVFAFSALAKQNEVVALRAAGVPFRRVVIVILPTVIITALSYAALAEFVVPRSQQALTAWWASLPPPADADPDTQLLWFRTDGAVVGVEHVFPDGRRLDGVHIYQRDDEGQLRGRIIATNAIYQLNHWTLLHAVVTDFTRGRIEDPQVKLDWQTPLKPADLMRLSAAEPYVSGGLAAKVLSGAQSGIKTPAFYRTRIQRAFADPVSILVMLLLATPVAVALSRGGQRGSPVLLALVCGLLFLLLNGLFSALGEASLLAPPIAAWAAPLLFLALGSRFLFRLDRL
jgi:lipopolysaccharide export system permease protein